MELWDILDSERKHTGRTVQRGKPMRQDEYHLVVHVWIQNSKGEFLIQQRAPNKSYPLLWAMTGGSAVKGDDSLTTAIKETSEELGAKLEPENGRIIHRQTRQHHDYPDFVDVWLFQQDFDLEQLELQTEEVADAKWVSKEEIRAMMENGEFTGDLDYLEEFLQKHA
jgi:8-oxo-dGTP pyrophosphatase MutT (NUDIX family)